MQEAIRSFAYGVTHSGAQELSRIAEEVGEEVGGVTLQ